jgi:membrane-associated protease RseP (regulator of RpoE activity)
LQIVEGVEARIYSARGLRVMLSPDLAELYGIPTKVLLQSVRRNIVRFPQDFAFQLTPVEFEALRSQTVTSGRDGARAGTRGGARYAPFAFTEQGVAMLSGVLRGERAVAVNIEIMRTFVKLRSMLESNKDLAKKLVELEAKYDRQFASVFEAIRELTLPPVPPKKKPIGFVRT